MHRNLTLSISLLFFGSMFYAFAEQASAAKTNDDMKEACEISAGIFTVKANGDWSCCWEDWGCYGCIAKMCKIKCNTTKCKKANGISEELDDKKAKEVKGLAPAGSKPPVAPIRKHKLKNK